MKKLLALATAALACSAVALTTLTPTDVAAQNASAIAARKALLKEMGDSLRPVGPMLRGQAPFALEPVQAALRVIATNAGRLPANFPADSRTGETDALPAIWERKAEFDGLFATLASSASTAQGAIRDEATFRATMPGVLRTCGTCHDSFRVKR